MKTELETKTGFDIYSELRGKPANITLASKRWVSLESLVARDAKIREVSKEIKELQEEVFTETMRIIGDDFGETQCADSLTELQTKVNELLLLLEAGKK